jgi:hypothetical protein
MANGLAHDPAAIAAAQSLVQTGAGDAEIRAAMGAAATAGVIAIARSNVRRAGSMPPPGVCRSCGTQQPRGFERIGAEPWPEATLCPACEGGALHQEVTAMDRDTLVQLALQFARTDPAAYRVTVMRLTRPVQPSTEEKS